MGRELTDDAAKRLLVRSVFAIHVMASAALLRRVGTPDAGGRHPAFGGIPGNLLRDVAQVGSPHVRIHASRLEAHRGH